MTRYTFVFGVAAALSVTTAHAADAPFFKMSGEASLATAGISKGITETDWNPQGLVGARLTHGWFYAGARVKSVRTPEGGDGQFETYVGADGKAGGFDLSLQAIRKQVDNTRPGTDNVFMEYQGSIGRTFDKTTLKLIGIWSPDAYGKTRQASWTEVNLAQKLSPKWTISGGAGHRVTSPKKDYTGWNAGVTYALLPKTSLDLRWYDTDAHDLGLKYRGHAVLKISQKF